MSPRDGTGNQAVETVGEFLDWHLAKHVREVILVETVMAGLAYVADRSVSSTTHP